MNVLDEWQRWQVAQGLSPRTIKERRIVILHLTAQLVGQLATNLTLGSPALRAAYHGSYSR
jgi:hypothetical protein